MFHTVFKGLKSLIVACFSVALIASSALANESTPLDLVKSVTGRMTKVLIDDRAKISQNERYLIAKIDKIVLPHFDLMAMSRSVVGRNYWNGASESTQKRFVKTFTKYVENTYSNALKSYNGEEIKFFPLRGQTEKRAQVGCDLMIASGVVHIVYNLYLKNDKWLIYDFAIDNVSLVKNYNAQFAGVLRQKGLEGLVQELQQNNGAVKAK